MELNLASTFRDKNERDKRSERSAKDSHTSWANIRGNKSTKKSGQNFPRKDPKVKGF